ncbi:methyltransferase domain-containing protein [Actinoallomurus sp. NPDC052308]|uniref:SAM-dependent methyltransferase n=1 Tax=Actinoallomurus sp. NPDC052308 TaxID=3155530 RepID=UPI003426931E
MTEQAFDADGLFDDDYLHFFAEPLDDRADAETDLIWRLLDLEPGMEVLDLACGHGRIANRLAERGCRVTGLDATPAFLERARQDAEARRAPVAYVEGDMRSLPWERRFDRVVNWFTAFGYFDDEDNRRVLTEAARVLAPGGRFAVELNNRDWIIRNFQPASVIERDGDLMIDQRTLDPLTGRAVTERTVVRQGRVRRIPFFVRMFTFTELRDWLLAVGFRTVTGHGDEGGPLTPDSRRMIVVART